MRYSSVTALPPCRYARYMLPFYPLLARCHAAYFARFSDTLLMPARYDADADAAIAAMPTPVYCR